jgi:hypothetical protein
VRFKEASLFLAHFALVLAQSKNQLLLTFCILGISLFSS